MTKRIDIHHHPLPDFLRQKLEEASFLGTSYAGFPDWSPGMALDFMERMDVAGSVFSFSAPGVYYGDQKAATGLARRCNEYLAELIQAHPGRFAGLAILPLPDPEAALTECVYALDELGLDGVGLLSNVDGIYAGHEDWMPLFAELDRRGSVVFVHPTYPPPSETRALEIPSTVMEFMFETTRMVGNLIFSGLLEQCPNIRFVIPHSGGAVPFLAHRMAVFGKLPKFVASMPAGVHTYLGRLHFDTATSGDPLMLAALRKIAEQDHILFGTDFPYMKEDRITAEAGAIDEFKGFDGTSRQLMEWDNALALFPRLGPVAD